MLTTWNLRKKLFTLCIVLTLILGICCAWFIVSLVMISRDASRMTQFDTAIDYVEKSLEINGTLTTIVRLQISDNSPLLSKGYDQAQQNLSALFDMQLRFLPGSDLASSVENQRSARAQLSAIEARVQHKIASGDTASALALFSSEEYLDAQGSYTSALENYITLADGLWKGAVEEHDKEIQDLVRIAIIFLVQFSIVSIVCAILVSRYVLRSVSSMEKAVQAIGKGNFSHRVPVSSQDELGQLATAINKITMALTEDDERGGKLAERLKQITHTIGQE